MILKVIFSTHLSPSLRDELIKINIFQRQVYKTKRLLYLHRVPDSFLLQLSIHYLASSLNLYNSPNSPSTYLEPVRLWTDLPHLLSIYSTINRTNEYCTSFQLFLFIYSICFYFFLFMHMILFAPH